LQNRSEANHRSRVIASNNVMGALFMVLAAILTIAMLAAGFSVREVFLATAIVNGLMTIYICQFLPVQILHTLLRVLLTLLYRVRIQGMEHFLAAKNEPLLIVANHISLLDPALIATFLPEKLVFAINTYIAKRWWMQPFLSLVEAFRIDPAQAM